MSFQAPAHPPFLTPESGPGSLECPAHLEELFADHLADEAAIAASEICSPNSHEWGDVRRSREEDSGFRSAALVHFLQRWVPSPVPANGLHWPLTTSPSVAHVGYFDPSLKSATHNVVSLEGNGLSVSPCPAIWRQIARLGDAPTWVMQRYGSRFLDAHALTPLHRDAVDLWACANGLTERIQAKRLSYDDLEPGGRISLIFDFSDPTGEAMAMAELEDQEDANPILEDIQAFIATNRMHDRVGFKVPIGLVQDIALTMFAEDVLYPLHDVDGVWWKDVLAPAQLSAPRGVIHLSALAAWRRDQLKPPSRPRPAVP